MKVRILSAAARGVSSLGAVVVLCSALVCARAQDASTEEPATKPPSSALGVRQDHVKRMMQDLEQKFVDLARTLEKTEPGQAKRLVEALQKSKEARIDQRMGALIGTLDGAQFDAATAEQKEIVAELKRLIALLLDEDDQWERMRKEMERLRLWQAKVEELIKEETGHKRESEKVGDKEKTLADLAEQIAALEKLIKAQQQVIDKTIRVRAQGIQGLPRVAADQAGVCSGTESLAKEIGLPAAGGAAPSGSEGRPSGTEAGGSESGAGGSGSSGGGAGAASASAGGQSDVSEPGQKPLGQAIKQQKAAEKNLIQARGKAAEKEEREALDSLKQALRELKQELRRVETLPPEVLEKMAEKQDRTADKTAGLGEEMAKATEEQKAAGGTGSGQGGGGEGGAGGGGQPGQQDVQEAQQSMQQASGGLRKKDPKGANKEQREAIEALRRAREAIERRLAQLRKEMQIEQLAALEARFREMLSRQQPVTQGTTTIEKLKLSQKLQRADRLTVIKYAEEERLLAEMAQTALDILIDDGTGIVFPNIVEELRDDLNNVNQLLKEQQTDVFTQTVQQEIETTLKELIAALEKAIQQLGQGGGSGSGQAGKEPLLPGSAELKLLKSAQLRVNRLTKAFETARPKGALDAARAEQVLAIAKRQEQIAVMTEKMIERSQ